MKHPLPYKIRHEDRVMEVTELDYEHKKVHARYVTESGGYLHYSYDFDDVTFIAESTDSLRNALMRDTTFFLNIIEFDKVSNGMDFLEFIRLQASTGLKNANEALANFDL